MRKFTADFVFPVSSAPIKNGVVVTDDDGKILEVNSPLKSLPATAEGLSSWQAGPLSGKRGSTDVQYYPGIIVPGFVNAHCHLELSHLKTAIAEKTGLDEFIMGIE